MNEEINWDDAPEGYDLHVSIQTISYNVRDFAKDLGNGYCRFYNAEKTDISVCKEHGVVTERPVQEKEPPPLTEEDSLQGQLSHIGDLLYNLSCSMENEVHQDILGTMASNLWEMSKLYRQTPEQKLRARVWDVVAETDICESDIDAITTGILEKFKLEEK